MSDNPKTYEVILFDRCEMSAGGSEGSIMTVYNLDGTPYKIGSKRQALWGVFNNSPRMTPILLTFETFTPRDSKVPITYLADASVITADDCVKAGIKATLERLLTSVDDTRNRSQALAYAKDLAVSGQIKVDVILEQAITFFGFIKGIPMEKIDGNKNGNETHRTAEAIT